MSHKLHFFYPENDSALAADKARYTAPDAAVRLRRSGATLPLWFGNNGDEFISQGVNAAWLDKVKEAFGIDIDTFTYDTSELVPSPWGWSKAARQTFIDLGFSPDRLPSDTRLNYIRALSHRRNAARAAARLSELLNFSIAPPAVEIHTPAQIEAFIAANRYGAVFKQPWSSSGRGIVTVSATDTPKKFSSISGMLRRQGSLTAEPFLKKTADFAMLFTMTRGKCVFDGYSLFSASTAGAYQGNVLAPQSEIYQRLCTKCPAEHLDAVRDTLPAVIEELASDYDGPLGVDMMTVESENFFIAPVVEINFRMTMGHLCRLFYAKHVVDGATGTFSVHPAQGIAGIFAPAMNGTRMAAGIIDMAQPGSDFSFTVELR